MRNSHPPARRRRGRPPQRGDASQRERLLDAALLTFSQHGVAATRLSAIAQAAQVTPALLHYYFRSREQLLDVLVSERIAPMMLRNWTPPPAAAADLRGLLRHFVVQLSETVAAHPWLPPLWSREVLDERGLLRQRLIDGVVGQIAPRLAATIQAAQARGECNPDIDARLLLISLIGLTMFPHAVQGIWRALFDTRDIDADLMVRHTLALLERGMEFSND